MFTHLLLLLLTVSGSVAPIVEGLEQIETLQKQKYTKRQFTEIEKALEKKEQKIRLMSYNILFDLFDERWGEENRWKNRSTRVLELIKEISPDILGVQELYKNQLKDLLSQLGESYAFVSRDPLIGETNGIFYRKDRFTCIDQLIWDTPHVSQIHISDHLTDITLLDSKTDRSFSVLNAHFAFTDINTRESQAEFAGKLALSKKNPVLFMGDLNIFPARPELYKLPFFDGDYIHRVLSGYGLKEAREWSLLGHVGPLATFTNEEKDTLPFKGTGTPGIFTDHLYVSPGVTVIVHAIEPALVDGHFPSDHMPVFADILIE